jgi:hypothetical protein
MAPRLSWWLVAGAVGCLVVGAAYLPPRGTDTRPRRGSFARPPAPTPEAERAIDLAAAWRRADLALQMARRRQALRPELDRRRNADLPTLAVAFEGTIDSVVRARITRAADTIWQRLALGTSKIGVGIIVASGPDATERDHPRRVRPLSPAFAFPDSLDRHTCLAYVALSRTRQVHVSVLRDLDGVLRRTIGPCAFYAAFGRPAPVIERWLGARRYDIAMDVAWDRGAEYARAGASWFSNWMPSSEAPWMWHWLYQAPPATVGCIGGRASACGDYVLAGANATGLLRTTLATDFERRGPTLPGATLILSDALREFGAARFARFWTTRLPVDSAFRIAMDTSLAQWITDRQRTLTPWLPIGPAVPFTSSVLSVLAVLVAIALAIVTGQRRQVR